MGYKKIDKSLDFADLALASSLKHNRSLKLMEKIDKAIDWSRVESILMGHYVVGTSSEGADAYPPLLLFKSYISQVLKNGIKTTTCKCGFDPHSKANYK